MNNKNKVIVFEVIKDVIMPTAVGEGASAKCKNPGGLYTAFKKGELLYALLERFDYVLSEGTEEELSRKVGKQSFTFSSNAYSKEDLMRCYEARLKDGRSGAGTRDKITVESSLYDVLNEIPYWGFVSPWSNEVAFKESICGDIFFVDFARNEQG